MTVIVQYFIIKTVIIPYFIIMTVIVQYFSIKTVMFNNLSSQQFLNSELIIIQYFLMNMAFKFFLFYEELQTECAEIFVFTIFGLVGFKFTVGIKFHFAPFTI